MINILTQENLNKIFFVNYYNTKKGYYSEIIYKYNWTYLWIVDSKYDYYNILTKYGNCRCYRNSGNLVFSHFNFEFKNNIFNGNITKNEINWSEKIKYEKKEMIGAILGNIQYLINKDKERIVNKNIDIVYLMDSTGSIGDEVKIASNLLIQHAQSLYKNNPEKNFQFGFVYYNDPIDVNTDYNDYLQLTKDINKVGRFCDNWKIQDGGDLSEDWVGGYNLSINGINWRNGKRIIVHVCDAPAHGKKYSKNENDNHKEEKYDIELDNMMKECAMKNIEIIGIYIKMIMQKNVLKSVKNI